MLVVMPDDSDGRLSGRQLLEAPFPLTPQQRVELAQHLVHCAPCRLAYESMERQAQEAIAFRAGFLESLAGLREIRRADSQMRRSARRARVAAMGAGVLVGAACIAVLELLENVPGFPSWSAGMMPLAIMGAMYLVGRWHLERAGDREDREREERANREDSAPDHAPGVRLN